MGARRADWRGTRAPRLEAQPPPAQQTDLHAAPPVYVGHREKREFHRPPETYFLACDVVVVWSVDRQQKGGRQSVLPVLLARYSCAEEAAAHLRSACLGGQGGLLCASCTPTCVVMGFAGTRHNLRNREGCCCAAASMPLSLSSRRRRRHSPQSGASIAALFGSPHGIKQPHPTVSKVSLGQYHHHKRHPSLSTGPETPRSAAKRNALESASHSNSRHNAGHGLRVPAASQRPGG